MKPVHQRYHLAAWLIIIILGILVWVIENI